MIQWQSKHREEIIMDKFVEFTSPELGYVDFLSLLKKEAIKNYISAKAAYLNENITNFKNIPMFQGLENTQNNKIRKKYQPWFQLSEATTISF